FVVRAATVDDADGIARVHVESWRETYARLVEPGELDDLSVERRTDRWRQILDDGGSVWVAVSKDEVAGFAGLGGGNHENPPRAVELGSLYLLAAQHGTGAGQALLDAAIGDSPAFLFVARDNPRAIRFYERNGFAFDGVSEEYPLVRTPIVSLRMVR
ncbi:MAG: GNAT family N-acetyltransferase, partial [Leifsonia sp.]